MVYDYKDSEQTVHIILLKARMSLNNCRSRNKGFENYFSFLESILPINTLEDSFLDPN